LAYWYWWKLNNKINYFFVINNTNINKIDDYSSKPFDIYFDYKLPMNAFDNYEKFYKIKKIIWRI